MSFRRFSEPGSAAWGSRGLKPESQKVDFYSQELEGKNGCAWGMFWPRSRQAKNCLRPLVHQSCCSSTDSPLLWPARDRHEIRQLFADINTHIPALDITSIFNLLPSFSSSSSSSILLLLLLLLHFLNLLFKVFSHK